MLADVLNQQKEKVGSMDLPKSIFDVKLNSDLVHQIYLAMMANQRIAIAHTKGRGEVRGGGRKPWRQKGTGRARHGSIRSPIWRGGGVTFGPKKTRNFSQKINKKMKNKALLMLLSQKFKDGNLFILDKFAVSEPKTKLMAKILTLILDKPKLKKSYDVLILTANPDERLIRSGRNLVKTWISEAKSINVIDLLKYKYLVITKEVVEVLEKLLIKS